MQRVAAEDLAKLEQEKQALKDQSTQTAVQIATEHAQYMQAQKADMERQQSDFQKQAAKAKEEI